MWAVIDHGSLIPSSGCFCREVGNLRVSPVSDRDAERNVELAEHQRHCVSPDRLFEVACSHVRFRPQHGERSRGYELLHSPRLLVVQDNVEVVEHRDAALYSTVMETPSYRFTMATATNNKPGKKTTDFGRRCQQQNLQVSIIRIIFSLRSPFCKDRHVSSVFPS